ncbi:hypothetical protein FEI13_16125 [Halomonas urmiana]|uniref:Uncharacterized protein n=1 Tax=Halomonas urmiana TaxID=490901 RepID=A0A5R8MEY3_9GAMM|nr:hypothetical protein [Halomonas urmiana]TLF47289.1 hypothetical protein FEI13_16125 [Halomonas urmiana]
MMPRYEVTGVGKDSGRKRRKKYSAIDENAASAAAEKDGTTVEAVTELPPEPPTERQMEYAISLGLTIPADVTKNEISDLISLAQDDDSLATPLTREAASRFGIELTQYTGEKNATETIWHHLSRAGKERELLTWLAYNTYLDITGSRNSQNRQLDDPVFSEIASELENDASIISSAQRQNVDRRRTKAYKAAAQLVRKKTEAKSAPESSTRGDKPKHDKQASPRETPPPRPSIKTPGQRQGCLSVIFGMAIIPAAIAAAYQWLPHILL